MISLRLAALALVIGPVAFAQEGPEPVLQPRTYHSPDGHWTLDVDPSRRDGGGSGNWTVRKDGELVWRDDRSLTPWEAVVTDSGFIGAYAYSNGCRDYQTKGEFHALVVSPSGSLLSDAKLPRTESRMLHTAPDPLGLGIVHLQSVDRLIFRVHDAESDDSGEAWWCFQLPEGRELYRKRPQQQRVKDEALIGVMALKPVNGTSLMLAQWGRFEIGNGPSRQGCVFALFDPDSELIWQLERADDWKSADRDEEEQLWNWMREGRGILDVGDPRCFAVWAPAPALRLDFEVKPGLGEKVGWTVVEKGSRPQSPPTKEKPAREVMVPEIQLESRGITNLESRDEAAASAIRDIDAFVPENNGGVRFVRHESKPNVFTLLEVDPKGQARVEHEITIDDAAPALPITWWSISDHVWIVTQSPYGENARASAWSVDELAGTVHRLTAFDSPAIESVAGFGDGRFVVSAMRRVRYGFQDVLAAFDSEGALQWKFESSGWSKDSDLFSAAGVTVNGRGDVVVAESGGVRLQLFDNKGVFLRIVDLKSTAGMNPQYLAGVTWDTDGGVMLHDSSAQVPLWRLDASGVVRKSLTPKLADGRAVDILPFRARVAPDGRIWTTDGATLFRLDDKGTVDVAFGFQPGPDVLRETSAAAVDTLGRVLIQDGKTGAVHVFDAGGKRLFIGRPSAASVGQVSLIAKIGATRGGGVMVARDDRALLEFGPHGLFIGLHKNLPEDLAINPVNGLAAGTKYRGTLLFFDADWHQVRELDRRPDRHWLRDLSDPSISPDGTVGVLEDGMFMHGDDEPGTVLLYASNGEGGRMITLPAGVNATNMTLGSGWAVLAGYGPLCWLVKTVTGETHMFHVEPLTEYKRGWRWGFSSDGHELLGVELDNRRVHHFALP